MITINDAIREVQRKMETTKQTVAISDDAVTHMVMLLGERGYRPSEQIVEPIRAFLAGYSLLLTGDAGLGKTFLMRCLRVRSYAAENIVDYGLSRIHQWYDWTDERDICIDDLGSERTVAEYGAKDDVLKAVIDHRIDHQTDRHDPTNLKPPRTGRTHVTTNLNAAQIASRYGDRTLSRLLGMCKPFTFTGKNMREPQPTTGG